MVGHVGMLEQNLLELFDGRKLSPGCSHSASCLALGRHALEGDGCAVDLSGSTIRRHRRGLDYTPGSRERSTGSNLGATVAGAQDAPEDGGSERETVYAELG
jgi:hypothetical protein